LHFLCFLDQYVGSGQNTRHGWKATIISEDKGGRIQSFPANPNPADTPLLQSSYWPNHLVLLLYGLTGFSFNFENVRVHCASITIFSFYSFLQFSKLNLSFSEIVHSYKQQPECRSPIFRRVFVDCPLAVGHNDDGPQKHVGIITFYNDIFTPSVWPLVMELVTDEETVKSDQLAEVVKSKDGTYLFVCLAKFAFNCLPDFHCYASSIHRQSSSMSCVSKNSTFPKISCYASGKTIPHKKFTRLSIIIIWGTKFHVWLSFDHFSFPTMFHVWLFFCYHVWLSCAVIFSRSIFLNLIIKFVASRSHFEHYIFLLLQFRCFLDHYVGSSQNKWHGWKATTISACQRMHTISSRES